jgi:phosphoribosylformylglycinamidine synthase subunit PurL
MLSESQERMLLVAEKGREDEVLRVFAKWGLDAVIVGTVQPEPRLRIRHHGELVADIPNQSLTDDAPLYHRPVGTWKAPVPLDPPEEVLAELAEDRDYTADLKKLLASAQHLLQALGSRAVRHHGADQHRASAPAAKPA